MTRIYVGGIPTDCRERDLDKFFRNYGRLRDCLIKNGYAFVEFEDNRDADDAVYEMNGRELMGCRVSVEHARGIPRRGEAMGAGARRAPAWTDRYGPPMRTPYRVIVENLSSRISWQDLKDYMRKEADVTFADAHRHARNEGIVEFASSSDMKRAIDRLDDTELMGRRIKMINDCKESSRSRSRRKSRSRSRSRSRRRRSYSSSRSRSRSRRRSRSRSRSRSNRDKSRSRSRSRSRDSKRSRSPAKENSKSRSRSPSQKKEDPDKANGSGDQNGKRSRSRSRSQSRSRSDRGSPSPKKARTSHSRSRSNDRGRSRSRSQSAN